MKSLHLIVLVVLPISASAQIPLENGVKYTQDFNGMTAGGPYPTTYADIVDPPSGWSITGNAANVGDAEDRALGVRLTPPSSFGAQFLIQSGGPKVNLQIAFTGEQWYQAFSHPSSYLDFEYSTDATSLSTGTWTQLDALDYRHSGIVLPLGDQSTNGNLPSFREAKAGMISLTNVAHNSTLWIRWTTIAVPGQFSSDPRSNGLSVDDFSITATADPGTEPSLRVLSITYHRETNLVTLTYQSIDGEALGVKGGKDLAFNDILPDTEAGDGGIMTYLHNPPGDTDEYFYRLHRKSP